MLLLPKKSPRGLYLPPGVPRIDWTNPITEGLIGCWVATGEGGAGSPILRDLVTQTTLAPTNSVNFLNTQCGLVAKDNAVGGWSAVAQPTQMPTLAVSMMWFGQCYSEESAGEQTALIGCGYSNSWSSPVLCMDDQSSLE